MKKLLLVAAFLLISTQAYAGFITGVIVGSMMSDDDGNAPVQERVISYDPNTTLVCDRHDFSQEENACVLRPVKTLKDKTWMGEIYDYAPPFPGYIKVIMEGTTSERYLYPLSVIGQKKYGSSKIKAIHEVLRDGTPVKFYIEFGE